MTIGGTTLDDTFIAVKTKIVNTGAEPARVGVRRLWDLHLLKANRPAFSAPPVPFGVDGWELSIPRPDGDVWSADDGFHGLGRRTGRRPRRDHDGSGVER